MFHNFMIDVESWTLYIKFILDMDKTSECNTDFKEEQNMNILRLSQQWKTRALNLKSNILFLIYKKECK